MLRLTLADLNRLRFVHQVTTRDHSVQADAESSGYANCAAGLTEWAGVHKGALVSLGWDWVLLHDGPAQLTMVPPRCNFVLVDARGFPLAAAPSLLHQAVETILWKPTVLTATLDGT